MQCPYCAEDIREQAIVCKHCHRDLIALKPLMEENATLRAEVDALKQRVAGFPERAAAEGAATPAAAQSLGWRIALGTGKALLIFLLFVVLPSAALIGIHYLFVIKLDLSTISLRVASMVVPAIFGVLLAAKARQGLVVSCLVGVIVGVGAVAGMLTVVGIVDKVPIVPANSREWQEVFEYAFSIMLATVTGALAGRVWLKFEEQGQARLAGGGDGPAPDTRTDRMMRVEMLITGAGAVATAIGSLIAGLKGTAE